ncbi:hypothetical protein FBU59_001137 [Linderina macrospora]|uniref:Uncharacterized protein n=1 Tax=Linderina macrospora TaxID=4868 RepID=A0ACC1JEX0_9FUNG|nr:hypothetical protein FBU59_001137 [Linderina macrospora]
MELGLYKEDTAPLSWSNVGMAASMLVITVVISRVLRLHLEQQIVVAAARCVVQLTVLGLVLKSVFSSTSALYVFGLAGKLPLQHAPSDVTAIPALLGGLAAVEVTQWRAKHVVRGMLPISFVCIFGSALLVSLLGGMYAMNFDPPYVASKFIPILGMLLGNTMVGVALGMESVLGALDTRRDTVEAMLCFGASRWEVVRPLVVDATRSAMIPTITMVSITGLISIPGMMSGQILGGADVMDAAKYQQVIMFMIAASTSLGVVLATIAIAYIVVDAEPKLRTEKVGLLTQAPKPGGGALRVSMSQRQLKQFKSWART